MTVEAPLGDGLPVRPGDEHTNTLFRYELARDGRLVARLVGIGDGQTIRVVGEIYPVLVPETTEPQWRFYDFPNREQAERFADEAVLALEYLGCTVAETRPQLGGSATDVRPSSVAAA